VHVRVRELEPTDLPACLDLFAAVCAEGRWLATEAPVDRRALRSRWEALLETGDGALVVAEPADGGPPAGLLALVGRARPELGMLVDARLRGRGVGEALLRAALERARADGAAEVVLHVFLHNGAAIALYERLGFERRGTLLRAYPRRGGERWDALRMVKPLAPTAPASLPVLSTTPQAASLT
jgi:ribosomal protein S18 acetylase RimI-like enzyme